mmetsp:Transcript_30965/g.100877  ORF Transcript_30965/g.100877 Transcript_30965/m.100877 type:complete len:436 (+) Transcript_30965:3-1310(+)
MSRTHTAMTEWQKRGARARRFSVATRADTRTSSAPLQPQRFEDLSSFSPDFRERLAGKLVLAPLTKGGNLPYRRLVCDFGAEVTMGEMSFSRFLLKGDRVERTRLRIASEEQMYGFQFATNTISEGVRTSQMALEAGASWVDLNCGCPIYEATRRGLGAELLGRPAKLRKLVQGIAADSPLPLTVKIRTGVKEGKTNVLRVVRELEDAGAAAVIIHGRTKEQRYKSAADWNLIGEAVQQASIPIIGNGDILTHYEAEARMKASGCHAVLVGRGALIKPWIFQEFKEGRVLRPTDKERVGIYRRFVAYLKEAMGDDSMGKRKGMVFLPWHFSFFHRYRPLEPEFYAEYAQEKPLINLRMDLAALGEDQDLPPLERVLRSDKESIHQEIAEALWDATSDDDAVLALENIATRAGPEGLMNGSGAETLTDDDHEGARG